MKKLLMLFGVLSAIAAYSQSSNAPVFAVPTKANGDVPVILEWQSQPQGLYNVEFSTLLTSNSWTNVAENFPSQGTTTRWTDRGNPAVEAFRFSSADPTANYRFYRLRYMTNWSNAPVTVTITNLSSGATLSNSVTVQGSATATQGISLVKILVDGFPVGRSSAGDFSQSFDTRLFDNGPHRITAQAADNGAYESTEEVNSLTQRGAAYGNTNLTVMFDNFISAARLKYEAFRPDLGQTQQVFARWSSQRFWRVDISPKGDPSTVYRSFTGGTHRVVVVWDGRSSTNQLLNPQLVDYNIYDLGVDTNNYSGGGGSGGPSPSPNGAMAQGQNGNGAQVKEAPPLPYPWEPAYWPKPKTFATADEFQAAQAESANSEPLLESTATYDSASDGGASLAAAGGAPDMILTGPYIFFAKVAVAGQGHHPLFGTYLTPVRLGGFGRVRMASRSQSGPWGPLKRVNGLVRDVETMFPLMGFPLVSKKLDDEVKPFDLRPTPTNMFNLANIGLFIGHSVAAIDLENGYLYRQAYVPIYNSVFNTMDWPRTHDMPWGSTNLKWMAFYSCNLLRDNLYRNNGIFSGMQQNFTIPMNNQLHVLQAFATEMSVHPDGVFWWTWALQGKTENAVNHTVLGAWAYMCRHTQNFADDQANVSRSVYWPECAGDYVYGYGTQTNPSRSNDPTEQADLQTDDEFGNAPEP